jgi:hypothetical protein
MTKFYLNWFCYLGQGWGLTMVHVHTFVNHYAIRHIYILRSACLQFESNRTVCAVRQGLFAMLPCSVLNIHNDSKHPALNF